MCNNGLEPKGGVAKLSELGVVYSFDVSALADGNGAGWIIRVGDLVTYGLWSGQSHFYWTNGQIVPKNPNPLEKDLHIKAQKIYELSENIGGSKFYKNFEIIPLKNKSGVISSLQFINKDGEKAFLGNGNIDGLMNIIDFKSTAKAFLICKDYDNGLSINKWTRFPVFCAFTSENMEFVARIIKEKYRMTPIIFCSDNDRAGDNSEIKHIADLAGIYSGQIVTPIFNKNEAGTTFKDLGETRTRKTIDNAIWGKI